LATTNSNFKVKNGLDAGGTITSTGLTITGTLAHSGASSPITLNGSVGTSGQVLTSAGEGATPTWTTVSGGGSLGYIGTTQSTASSGGTTALNGIRTMTPDASFTLSQSSVSTAGGRSITIQAGNSTNASGTGGDVILYGGTSNSSAAGVAGNVVLNAGAGGADNGPGFVKLGESNTSAVVVTPFLQIKNSLNVGTAGGYGTAGTSGQVLTSTGTNSPPTWTDKGYTLISSVAFSGSAPSFTSIPQTYKKLVAQIVFSSLTGLTASFFLNVNSSASCAFTYYTIGSGTAQISTSTTNITISAAVPVVSALYTIEIPNYTSTRPVILYYGTSSTSIRQNYGFASTDAAITQLTFSASAWGSAAGTAYLYGVN